MATDVNAHLNTLGPDVQMWTNRANSPCPNNGTCVNGADGYRCECPFGYKGLECADVDHCAVNRCQNGGTCVDGSGSFTCNCTENYGGATCKLGMEIFSPPCCCGKLMISQACVISSVHEGGASQHAMGQGVFIYQHAMGQGYVSQHAIWQEGCLPRWVSAQGTVCTGGV